MTSTRDTTPGVSDRSHKRTATGWGSVATLAPGAFALAATEFLPLGLVQPVSKAFSIPLGSAGLMVLIPGLVAAVAAPVAVVGAGRLPRKTYVVLVAAVLLVSNIVAALAPTYPVLLAARALAGLALGGFWAVVPVLTALLVPTEMRHRATSVVIAGISAGTVAGLPAGQFVGSAYGWRSAFGSLAVLAAVVLVVQVVVLRAMPTRPGIPVAALWDVLRDRSARLGLSVTVPAIVAQFAASTFVSPFLSSHAHLSTDAITVLLLVYAGAGIVGTLLGGALVARGDKATVTVAVLVLGVVLTALALTSNSVVAAVLVAIWGLGWGILPIALQTWLMSAGPDRPEAASAVLVTTFQLSIAVGALVGGVVVDSATLTTVFLAAGLLAAATGLYTLVRVHRSRRTATVAQ